MDILASIADQGAVLMTLTPSGPHVVLSLDSSIHPGPLDLGDDDAALIWARDNTGMIPFSELIGTYGPTALAPDGVPGCLIGFFHRGIRFCAAIRHSVPELTQLETRDLSAMLLLAADDLELDGIPTLAPRELAYLRKAGEGATDDEIAEHLNLSMRSVKERKKRAAVELRASSISHAIRLAKQSGQI